MIIKKNYPMARFGGDVGTVQSTKFQFAHRSQQFLLNFHTLPDLCERKSMSPLLSSYPSLEILWLFIGKIST